MTLLSPFMNIIMNCLNMSNYWIGAVLINAVVIENAASIATRVDIFADMIVFMSYAMQVIMSFIMIVMVFIVAPRALVAAKRINEVLETEPTRQAEISYAVFCLKKKMLKLGHK